MKFIFRSLIVLAVAAVLGIVLYYAVQALPNNPRGTNPSSEGSAPPNDLTAPGNQTSRPERPENNRSAGIRWGSIARVARRALMFSAIVFVTVLANRFLFGRRPNSQKKTGG